MYIHMCVCARVLRRGVDGWLRSDVTHGCKGFSLMMLSLMVHGRSSAQLGSVRLDFASVSAEAKAEATARHWQIVSASSELLPNVYSLNNDAVDVAATSYRPLL